MRKSLLLFGLVSIALLFCCSGGDRPEAADAGPTASGAADHDAAQEATHDHAEEHDHGHIKVPPEKQKAWGIEIGPAVEMALVSATPLPGVISLNENRTAHISSFTSGKVAVIRADLGKDVDKGEVLAVIKSPEFAQAQASFLQAHARANLMQKEYERAKALLEENAIEKKEYLRREAEFDSAATEHGVWESNLRSYGMTAGQIAGILKKREVPVKENESGIPDPNLAIRSPLKGKVIFRDVILGEHVGPEKTLFTVSDLSSLWAIVDAYEKDLPSIHEKSGVKVLSPLYPGIDFPGRIDNIGSTVDPKLRTIKIRAEIDNRKRLLKPNMFIQAVIESPAGTGKDLAVPEEAVQVLNGEKIVFLLEGNDVFAVQHVQTGGKFGEMRAVTGGIRAGQIIVLKGAFNLKAELNKGTAGHVHVH